jgi:hypothetical protein
MLGLARRHVATMLVAMVTAAVTASTPAMAGVVREAWFAHNADRLDGVDSIGYTTGGTSSSAPISWTVGGDFVELGSVTVTIEPRPRHVFIILVTNPWSVTRGCQAFIKLEWLGVQQEQTLVGVDVPPPQSGNGKASAVTSAMPVLPPGTQTIKAWGLTTDGCVGGSTLGAELDVVVLDN